MSETFPKFGTGEGGENNSYNINKVETFFDAPMATSEQAHFDIDDPRWNDEPAEIPEGFTRESLLALADPTVADAEANFSNQMENVSYDESIRKYVGGIVSPEKLTEIMDAMNELPPYWKKELEDYTNDLIEAGSLAGASPLGAEHAIATNLSSVEVPVDAGAYSPGASEGESNFWEDPKHRRLQKVVASVATAIGALVGASSAYAGGTNRVDPVQRQIQYEKHRVINDARAAGINVLFGVVNQALRNQGVEVNTGGPVPIPGRPVYGGVGMPPPPPGIYGTPGSPEMGVYGGAGMTQEQIKIEQKVIKLQQQFQMQDARVKDSYVKYQQACTAYEYNRADSRLQTQCANAYANFENAKLKKEEIRNKYLEAVGERDGTPR